jgi:plasmid stabilization system protein ParE
MRYRIIIAPAAESDLRNASSYIRRDNPRAARAWLKGARQRIKTLAQ